MSTAAGWLVVLFCAVVVGTALGGAGIYLADLFSDSADPSLGLGADTAGPEFFAGVVGGALGIVLGARLAARITGTRL